MAMSGWSTAPASNATVGSIDWAEGMAPAQVNNSARQMMTDQADWYRNSAEWILRTDVPVYVSSTQFKFVGVNLTSIYPVGRRIKLIAPTPGTIYGRISVSAFSADTTVTIVWDGTGLTNETLTSVAVGIISNASGSQSLDAGNIKRISEYGIPPGVMFPYGSTAAAPSGYLQCIGQTVSRTTYSALFAVVGTTYGSTDSATFKVPDRRGRSSFCLNNLGGSSGSAFVGLTILGGTGGSKTTTATGAITINSVTLSSGNLPSFSVTTGEAYDPAGTNGTAVWGTGVVKVSKVGTFSGSNTPFTPTGSFAGNAVNSAPPYMVDAWIIKT